MPAGIDDPNLTDDERAGLLVAHKMLVETGMAEWVMPNAA